MRVEVADKRSAYSGDSTYESFCSNPDSHSRFYFDGNSYVCKHGIALLEVACCCGTVDATLASWSREYLKRPDFASALEQPRDCVPQRGYKVAKRGEDAACCGCVGHGCWLRVCAECLIVRRHFFATNFCGEWCGGRI